jgi:hypothetical protein
MNIDAILLGMLAVADLAFLVHLRYRRRLAWNQVRIVRSMAFAVRREIDKIPAPAMLEGPPVLAKAS